MTQHWIIKKALVMASVIQSRQDTPGGIPGEDYPVPDFPEPRSSRQDLAIALIFLFASLALLLVLLRIYSRIESKQFGTGELGVLSSDLFVVIANT